MSTLEVPVWAGAWEAHFLNGPQKDRVRIWVVGPIWSEIRLAPHPGKAKGWFLSGGDGIPEHPKPRPGEEWEGEVRYGLHSARRARVDGQVVMRAYYKLAKDAPTPAR